MCQFKLLVAEDNIEDMTTCRNSVERYEHESGRSIKLIECRTVDDALQKLDNSFDGAIIDLKLAENGDEGNQILKKIYESLFRLPVAILTGTPDSVSRDFQYIGVFKKGVTEYIDIIKKFLEIHDTGLTRIMGGRGQIEQTLNNVFLNNLLPQLEAWKAYGKSDSSGTEKALLRYTLNHLIQILDDDEGQCFPEEVYIYPPLSDTLKTGSIIKEKNGDALSVILSPACDLVVRQNGQINTDRLLIVAIDNEEKVYGYILKKLKTNEERKEKISTILSNRHTLYHHWLPQTSFFPGGFINFRKLSALTKKEYRKKFDQPHIQISPHFVKDILSRFSSYYARQGQPDIDRNKIIEKIIASPEEAK